MGVRVKEGDARPVHQQLAVQCQSQPEVLKGQMRMQVGGSVGIVGALEQVGGHEGVSRCIGGLK